MADSDLILRMGASGSSSDGRSEPELEIFRTVVRLIIHARLERFSASVVVMLILR